MNEEILNTRGGTKRFIWVPKTPKSKVPKKVPKSCFSFRQADVVIAWLEEIDMKCSQKEAYTGVSHFLFLICS
jgi:CO dehydrogenase/acetyl-CoA synthase beta subunit